MKETSFILYQHHLIYLFIVVITHSKPVVHSKVNNLRHLGIRKVILLVFYFGLYLWKSLLSGSWGLVFNRNYYHVNRVFLG